MNNLILMIQFFTRIPLKKIVKFDEESYGKSTYMLPIIGSIISLFIFVIYKICHLLNFPIFLTSAIMLLCSIIITGGLHLDGLADSSDALFSYRTKEKMLEIMKDPQVGVNGVISLIVILLFKFIFYSYLEILPILFSFIIGRLGIIFSASFGQYARKKGMALAIIEYNNSKSFFKSLLITFLFFLFFKINIIYLFLTLIFNYWIHKKISTKLGGITGDTLGFICEISEVFFMFIMMIGERL